MILGDTGCDQHSTDFKEKCANPTHWPFPQLAQSALAEHPNLIMHVGDYNYSGTPGSIKVDGHKVRVYDAGDHAKNGSCKASSTYFGQNSLKSNFPDQWKYWQHDFFHAAKGLLASAPWVFARGNHELCSRAGPGWFYFLDANSPLTGGEQLSCPAASSPLSRWYLQSPLS
ncbi:hypothetical protein [Methyloprofundus sp.]|uniref:hypothetical protein n=1 Tax=Methyloprofundus sp. TaxID=2020875 RepID=UPI003D0BB9FE